MTDDELIWRIAGGSGDGIASTSQNFAKALMRAGLHVFTHRHYPSRIRGGHTYTEVRVSADSVTSRGDGYNFLLALGDSFARNPQEDAYYGVEEIKPLSENLDDLDEGGVIVYDTGLLDPDDIPNFDERIDANNWHVYDINLREIAREHGREVMRNTAGVAITCAIADIDPGIIKDMMADAMPDKIFEPNMDVFDDAYETVTSEFDATAPDISVPTGNHDEEQVLVSGSDAIAYGAIDEGCRFISGYPMTPWTEVFTIMSQNLPEIGGVSEQVEDEIAAAALAIGASHAGVKAMSGSSGGGFALMSEPLGLAEMTETPVVLIEAMRAGPSTGMPTKPEQGDLEHVLYTSQGDSHRVVFAPADSEEAYHQTRRAFEIAYEYQIPSIILYDQKNGGELQNIPATVFDEEPNPDLGSTLTEAELEDASHDPSGKYNRFQHAGENGVSPRSLPGQEGGRFLATGNEHMPAGHISEDPDNRVNQVDRRMEKLEAIRDDLETDGQTRNTQYGPSEAQYGILTFGSQQGTVREAIDELDTEGYHVKMLGVSELAPYPVKEVSSFIESVDEVLVVEMNASAQFRGLTQKELGRYGDKLSSLLKYNGNPFEPAEIVDGFINSIVEDRTLNGNETKYIPAASD
ncbi:2-oxoacid:acceptor oxidoreductase subunit alpha [Haloquadratum walsbyi]|jgi:Pyruvate:ferredoxin oxidoreductase and related 2-oxoacid:ferredoxin oxidoreductases, alpha subunit|uniref:2-oxoglutarate synthase subunit KorA n=1 Tax=Haloquadratum walsbyi (strain DSM 16854 / JCM 12705 / C23) TaxID=768065 RepID=G0LF50_HALWC|nr:2-oxoacid:acceptor oxidoreductase subunit alpha [Haloquadratum walsbyi]CCC41613.1 pyruvate--ferredoxin oxidoreductase alpha subunit [Haloquadratum walsbyi C23]